MIQTEPAANLSTAEIGILGEQSKRPRLRIV
jgi:hypothetical protein